MPKFNLDEVIGLGLQENVPVPEIAQAVNAWHKETLTEARYFVKDQEDFWKGTAAVDRQVSETLEGLKSMAQLEIAQQAFPNPVQFQQFNDVLASSGYDPDKMDAPQEWIDTAKRMDAIATSPAFNTPRHQYGKIGFGPNKLADYSLREKEDGTGYEAVVFPATDDGSPSKASPIRVDLPPRQIMAKQAEEKVSRWSEAFGQMPMGDELSAGETNRSLGRYQNAVDELNVLTKGKESEAIHIGLNEALKTNPQFTATIPQDWTQQFIERPVLGVMRSLAQAQAAATGSGRDLFSDNSQPASDILGKEGRDALELYAPGNLRSRFEAGEAPAFGDLISQGIESLITIALPGAIAKVGGAALRASSAAGEGMAVLQGARGANFAGSAGYGTLGASAYGSNYAQALAEADAAQLSGDVTKADRIRRFAQLTSLLNAGIEMATERIFPDEANLVSGKRITVRQIATMPLKEGIEGGVGAVGQNVVNLIDGKQDQNVLEAAWGEAVGSIPFMGRMTLKKILQKQPQTRSAAGPASAVRPDQSTTNTPTDPGSIPGTAPAPAPAAPANTAFSAGTGTDILPTGPGTVDGSLLAPPGVEMADPRPSTSSPSTLDLSTPRLSTSRPTETDPLGTIPETPATLDEQFRRVKSGTKPGMIFPGQTAKEVNAAYQPGQEDDFVLTDTPAGAVLHPVDIPRTEVRAAVAEDRLGHLLGYGIPRKPVPTPDSAPPIAVTLRTAEGTEVDSVLTTPELAPAVTEKLQARAEPGDTVQMETPQDVARQRIAPLTNPTPQDTVSLRADLVVDTPNAGATGTPPTPTSLQTRLPAPSGNPPTRTHAPNATAAAAASLQKSMPELAGGESVEFSPSVDAHLATPDGAARGYTPEQVAGMRTSEGFHDPATGRTVLFLDQLEARPGESARAAVARVLFHERIGHQGVNYLLKTDATFAAKWNALASQIPAADLAELRAQGYGHLTSGEVALEWLARQVDATARTQGGFKVDGLRGLARQLWDALRAVVNKILAQFGSTTAQRDVQLRELISRARRADVVRMGTGPIQFSKLPTPESNPTPSTVSPTPDYNINRFGLRVQADDRLRAAWRATFPPATYKTFTEEALRAQVREWMADNGGLEGATALFMDASSGLQDYERNALGQQLALSLDLRARRQENAKNAAGVAQTEAILDQVIATLETLATQAGQALRAFGMWSRFSPRGIVRAVQRETARKRDEHFQKTLGVDPAAALAAVNSDDPKEQEKLIKSLAPKTRAARDATPRFIRTLLEARRNGALSRADFLDAYSAAFNLPRFTPEFSSRIRELAARVESTPSGSWLRNRAQSDLMTAIANWEGLKTGDIWTAFWYANILSGLGTQLVNISGNAAHLLLKTSTVMLSNNPRHMMQFFKGLVSGATAGAKQAKEAFINGEPVMRGDEQWQKRDVLEMLWSDKPATWGKLLGKYGVASWGRYVFRALTAMDAMFYNTAKEARAFLEISRNLQPGQTMQTALGMDAATLTAAQAQAVADLKSAGVAATPNNIDRRTLEILESKRAPDVLATARKFGGAATYNYDPAGTMGAFAEGINAIIRGVPIVRAVIPFTRIVANITDQSLDWTGYGLIRAGLGRHTFNAKGERFTTRERVEKALAGAIGLAGMSALYALASSHADKDDDTVPFMIYGGGPLDKNKREQLPKGWKAYSVKVGDNYISYAETPLTLILGALGTALDKRRYSPTKPGDDDTLKRAELLLAGAGKSLSRAGILSGLNNLFGIIDGTANPKTFVARTASGFTPAQGLLRDVAKAMDPEAVDTSTIEGVFLQNLPVLRTQAGKKLNVFGEPVKEPGPWLISRLVTKPDRSDADAVWLTRNKLHIPDLDAEIVVGKYLTKDDLTRLQNGYAPTEAQRQALIAQRDAGYLTPQQRETLLRTTGPKLREAIKFLQNVQAATPTVSTKQLQTQLNAKVEAARQQAMRAVIGL